MHVIRLRKPWEKESGSGGVLQRVDVPDLEEQAVTDFTSVTRYRRRFNSPTRLRNARVRLRVSGWQGQLVSLRVNQSPIPVSEDVRHVDAEVTQLLRPHNEVEIALSGSGSVAACLNGEVSLAIEDTQADAFSS